MMTLLAILLDRARRHQIWVLLGLAALSVLVGAGLFSVTQHVSIGTSLYWAVTTASTVGYGDVTPHNAVGRVVAVGVMLTAIPFLGAAFAVLAAVVTTARLRRMLGMDRRIDEKPHVVIFGSHPAVPQVAQELVAAKVPVVVVGKLDEGILPAIVDVIDADPTDEEAIRRSRPEQARQALVAGPGDADVLVTAVGLRRIAPDLPIVAITRSAKVAEALHELGVQHTVSADDLLGHAIAKSLEAPHAADLLLSLVSSERYRLQELEVAAESVGRTLSAIRAEHSGLVLGLVQGNEISLGVGRDPLAAAGDRMLVVVPATKHS
jgi:voltage-gated potassium channel